MLTIVSIIVGFFLLWVLTEGLCLLIDMFQ